MTDLKIPNLNKNSDKFIFKKKLSLRRKSNRKIINETYILLSFSIFIIYINYLIPNKEAVFNNFFNNLNELTKNILNSIYYIYEIFLVIFIVVSIIFALIMMMGSFSRLIKLIRRKSRKISFK